MTYNWIGVVARTILAAIAGAITGFMAALAVCSVPAFFLPGQDAGVLGFVAFLWLGPAGIVVGASAGAIARKRLGLARCVVTMLVSIVVGQLVAQKAEEHAVPPLISANGCQVNPREFSSLMSGGVTITEWTCPGQAGRQLHVFIDTGAVLTDPVAPGNTLVLDAASDSPAHPLLVFVTGDSTGYTVAYDHRARVISQHARVGGKPVRFVERLASVDARGATPASDSAPPAPAAPPAPTCTNEIREQGMSQTWSLRIFKRTCVGQRPTIEVSVAPPHDVIDPDGPGNALSLDASAEAPGDTLGVRIARAEGATLTIGVDRRAPALRTSPFVRGIHIHTVVETDSALRRGSFDRQPSTPAAR